MSLELPDAYAHMPSLDDLRRLINRPSILDRSKRSIADLDVITSIASTQIQTAFSDVLRALDKAGLVNQRGYGILIQTLALKIFDEKRNERTPRSKLQFYITNAEAHFRGLAEKPIQAFIARMKAIREDASVQYRKILRNQDIDWKNQNHVRAVVAICQAFQDYSFVRSAKSDLYQLVFYNFANSFKRDEAAQFLTPCPSSTLLLSSSILATERSSWIPVVGSVTFSHLHSSMPQAKAKAGDWTMLTSLVSIWTRTWSRLLHSTCFLMEMGRQSFSTDPTRAPDQPVLVDLIPSIHRRGEWDQWPDHTELLKFDVVLTNPPFGEDRAYRVRSQADRDVIEMYETWHLARQVADEEDASNSKHARGKAGKPKTGAKEALDLGIVFLENAYRSLKENGRLGIVLSNSIASINRWSPVRKWLMERMRIVALFDLPANVFAETGVSTSIIIAYKPRPRELKSLSDHGYGIFVRDIHRVGYEKRTSKRNVFFKPIYKINEHTFEIEVDEAGNPLLDEEFTETLGEFRRWSLGQEEALQELFFRED